MSSQASGCGLGRGVERSPGLRASRGARRRLVLRITTDSSGLSLIEMVVVMGLFAVMALGVANVGKIAMRQQNQSNVTFQADFFRRSLVTMLNHDKAWQNTIKDAANSYPNTVTNAPFTAPPTSGTPGLNCLIGTGSPCTSNGKELGDSSNPTPISAMNILYVRDQSNALFYDSSTGSKGLTAQGTPCTGFVAPPNTGNDKCPLRFDVKWSAICTSGSSATCVKPQVQIDIVPTYNPGTVDKKIAFNPANYGASFIQGSSDSGASTRLGPITWF